jgi:phosphatidylinositol 3-kinase
VTGLVEVDIFKSSMAPFSLLCSTTAGETYRVMFKSGDDLRQDQLIIQMINLVDQLLKRCFFLFPFPFF